MYLQKSKRSIILEREWYVCFAVIYVMCAHEFQAEPFYMNLAFIIACTSEGKQKKTKSTRCILFQEFSVAKIVYMIKHSF